MRLRHSFICVHGDSQQFGFNPALQFLTNHRINVCLLSASSRTYILPLLCFEASSGFCNVLFCTTIVFFFSCGSRLFVKYWLSCGHGGYTGALVSMLVLFWNAVLVYRPSRSYRNEHVDEMCLLFAGKKSTGTKCKRRCCYATLVGVSVWSSRESPSHV